MVQSECRAPDGIQVPEKLYKVIEVDEQAASLISVYIFLYCMPQSRCRLGGRSHGTTGPELGHQLGFRSFECTPGYPRTPEVVVVVFSQWNHSYAESVPSRAADPHYPTRSDACNRE